MRIDFPFGVLAEGADPHRDDRGADSVNRMLLHGARYHDRDCVFIDVDGDRLIATPDFRADRNTVRAALALHVTAEIRVGARVALVLPLGSRLAIAERAVWALGAVSVVLDPQYPRSCRDRVIETAECSAVVPGEGDVDELVERGSVLDTPERAATFRRGARDVSAASKASLEVALHDDALDLVSLSQGDWARTLHRISLRYPPKRAARIVKGVGPRSDARACIHSGWADGITRTVVASGGLSNRRLRELEPATVVELALEDELESSGNVPSGFATLRGTDA